MGERRRVLGVDRRRFGTRGEGVVVLEGVGVLGLELGLAREREREQALVPEQEQEQEQVQVQVPEQVVQEPWSAPESDHPKSA